MSVTVYTGARRIPPPPRQTPPERALIAWAAAMVVALLIALLVAYDARARVADLHAPPVACDLTPVHGCPIVTSKGPQMIVYEGAGTYGLATMTPPARGGG